MEFKNGDILQFIEKYNNGTEFEIIGRYENEYMIINDRALPISEIKSEIEVLDHLMPIYITTTIHDIPLTSEQIIRKDYFKKIIDGFTRFDDIDEDQYIKCFSDDTSIMITKI